MDIFRTNHSKMCRNYPFTEHFLIRKEIKWKRVVFYAVVLDRNRIGSSKSERQIPKVQSKFCQIILYPFDRYINSKTTAEGCNFNNRDRFPKTFNHSGACSPVNWLSQTRGYLTNELLNLNFASRRKFCVLRILCSMKK